MGQHCGVHQVPNPPFERVEGLIDRLVDAQAVLQPVKVYEKETMIRRTVGRPGPLIFDTVSDEGFTLLAKVEVIYRGSNILWSKNAEKKCKTGVQWTSVSSPVRMLWAL